MSILESPLNRAHRYAANAEESMTQGLWIRAVDDHNKAAEAFLACIEASSEESTKRTLRLLYEEQNKLAKDLARKISKLREEGKDPTLPQNQAQPTRHPVTAQDTLSSIHTSREPGVPVDESFMVLPGQKVELSASFAQFWKLLEGMLDQLSQPVAFATAPLHGDQSSSTAPNSNSATEKSLSRDMPSGSLKDRGISPSSNHDSQRTRPDESDEDWELDEDVESMAESFYVVPSGAKAVSKPHVPELFRLQEENASLKTRLNTTMSRIVELERVMKERISHEQQLRDSIMQAQKAITSSQMFNANHSIGRLQSVSSLRLSTIGYKTPSTPSTPKPILPRDDSNLAPRITELEERIRILHVQDLTQKATIAKYKERWEKVKESMRRKKLAKAAAETSLSAQQNRIEEELEEPE